DTAGGNGTALATPTAASISIEGSSPTPMPTATVKQSRPTKGRPAPSGKRLTVRPLMQLVRVGAVETLSVSWPAAALLQLIAEYPNPGGLHRPVATSRLGLTVPDHCSTCPRK